ncbi:MAG: hypothetical protein V8R40_00105 [Dysosmobacter sp.]
MILTKIQNGQHQAYLVKDDHVIEASTKTEIAEAILVISHKKEHMTHITLAVTGSISAYKAADYDQSIDQIGI